MHRSGKLARDDLGIPLRRHVTNHLISEFKRTKPAPLENGTLSSENEAIRKDRSLFSYYSTQMSEEFWRNDDQPGLFLTVSITRYLFLANFCVY